MEDLVELAMRKQLPKIHFQVLVLLFLIQSSVGGAHQVFVFCTKIFSKLKSCEINENQRRRLTFRHWAVKGQKIVCLFNCRPTFSESVKHREDDRGLERMASRRSERSRSLPWTNLRKKQLQKYYCTSGDSFFYEVSQTVGSLSVRALLENSENKAWIRCLGN